ncbi:sulfonate ABC transporter ATP-binding protein, partial [Pseudomonas syringae pv. tagetis]
VLADGKIADDIRVDLSLQTDSSQPGFQAIRSGLLGVLGVKALAADTAAQEPTQEVTLSALRRVAIAR